MILSLKRYRKNSKFMQGVLFINGEFQCYTLEDAERCEKIHGQTAIPKGTYQIRKRVARTELTAKYRRRFDDWFDYHLELQDVPGFKYIYIHVGNTEVDTEGCLLVGMVAAEDMIGQSTKAFGEIYPKISEALRQGEEVFITIEDILI